MISNTGEPGEWFACTNEDFCKQDSSADSPAVKWRINWDNMESLHNWIEEYDLHCTPKYIVGLMGGAFFVAIVISALTLPRLADIIGRKKVFIFGLWLHTVALIVLMFSPSLAFTFGVLMFIGIASGAKAYVGYVYMMEFMPFKN